MNIELCKLLKKTIENGKLRDRLLILPNIHLQIQNKLPENCMNIFLKTNYSILIIINNDK